MKWKGYLTGLLTSLLLSVSLNTGSQNLVPPGKKIYIPKEFREMDFNDPASRYSYHRMAYSDNIVVFWEAGFGPDLGNPPELNGKDMRVDLENVLNKAESFYRYFRDTLHFLKGESKADVYRMMLIINYSEVVTAYGGAYDNEIGALWVTPFRLKDPKCNVIAHELVHSFQAQIGADGHLNLKGGPIWEMTSQWMLFNVNPHWMTDENYHLVDYLKKTHLAFMHPQNMYHSPYVLEFWSDKHGPEIIASIWNDAVKGEDAVTAYKRLSGIDQETFNAEMFEAAQKFMTWDFDRIRTYAKPYANMHYSKIKQDAEGWYAIAEENCPQHYGYNGIRLDVPQPGKNIRLDFEGLAPEEQAGGWRYGLVAVDKEGKVTYGNMQTKTKGKFRYRVPKDGLSHLWLVVSTAPEQHSPDTKTTWPYRFSIQGGQVAKEQLMQ